MYANKRSSKQNYNKKSYYKYKKKNTKSADKNTSNFTEKVQKVINSNIEVKHRQNWLCLNNGIHGGGLAINTLSDDGIINGNIFTQLSLAPGASGNHRVGLKVKVVKLVITGAIKSNAFSTSSNTSNMPYDVHVLFYKKKNDITGDPNTLKLDVNRNEVDIDGSISRELLPWNTQQYIIKKHLVKRMRPLPYVAASDNTVVGSYSDSRLPSLWQFKCEVPVASTLLFPPVNNTFNSIPTNDWCSLGIYYIDGSGAALPNSQIRAEASVLGTLYYTDA